MGSEYVYICFVDRGTKLSSLQVVGNEWESDL